MRETLITIQIHTMSNDIVSVIKHTDCKAVSVTSQLKLSGKSTRCCTGLFGPGDYSMCEPTCRVQDQDQQQASEGNHKFDLEVSLLDFQTSIF